MFTASLALAAVLLAAPTKTTPVEALSAIHFNAALADDTLMHHVVELTGVVSEVKRDGIGGYIVHVEGSAHEPDFLGRIEIHCHFAGTARSDLAKIKPGVVVTIRGVPRELVDHLHFPIDRNVVVTMKDCSLVAGAE